MANEPEEPSKGDDEKGERPDRSQRTLFTGALLLGLLLLLLFGATDGVGRSFGQGPLELIEFENLLRKNEVEEIRFKDNQAFVTLRPGDLVSERESLTWTVNFNSDKAALRIEELVSRLAEDHKIETHVYTERTNALLYQVLIWFLPTLLLIGALYFFLFRQMRGPGGPGSLINFGKSKHRIVGDKAEVTLKDVAGLDEARQDIEEIIAFLKNPEKFSRLGGRMPKGVLLVGQPGTGKTLLAKATAGEAGVPFFSVSGSDFVEMFVGVGASVTGDTPILIRDESGTRLRPISEFVDQYYEGEKEGSVVPVFGIETLGFEEKDSKFKGSSKTFVKGSAWKRVGGVLRHKVDRIVEIRYLGGVVRTTPDHSVFIRTRDGIKAIAAAELKPGDVLVKLPPMVSLVGAADSAVAVSGRSHLSQSTPAESSALLRGMSRTRAEHSAGLEFQVSDRPESGAAECAAPTKNWLDAMRGTAAEEEPAIVQEIVEQPFAGYVYDLCGCENEAFFGGEKPILLHNSRVRDLFEKAKENSPCIIFLDEVDAVGRQRGSGLGGGHDEREQTLNQILVEMDGFETDRGIIIMAATNRPDILDPALLRPGRFDRQVVIGLPNKDAREKILRVHARNKKLALDVDLKVLARATPTFSGAELEALLNEAALAAAVKDRDAIAMEDMEEARDKVRWGRQKKSWTMVEEELRATAYHEGGHAIVAALVEGCEPLHKVTIVPRGRALGMTMSLPEKDSYSMSRTQILARIAMSFGGRIGEKLYTDDLSTGASNDIEQATALARKMVTEWGMSELGPIKLSAGNNDMVFLGREMGRASELSQSTMQAIDKEVRRVLDEQHERAEKVILDNRSGLDRIAEALMKHETISGDEVKALLDGREIQRPSGGNGAQTAAEPEASDGESEGDGEQPTDSLRARLGLRGSGAAGDASQGSEGESSGDAGSDDGAGSGSVGDPDAETDEASDKADAGDAGEASEASDASEATDASGADDASGSDAGESSDDADSGEDRDPA